MFKMAIENRFLSFFLMLDLPINKMEATFKNIHNLMGLILLTLKRLSYHPYQITIKLQDSHESSSYVAIHLAFWPTDEIH
jgi:hypothetical protein